MGGILKKMEKLQIINRSFADFIENLETQCADPQYEKKHEEFMKYYEPYSYEARNLMVYFIFRYYLKAVYDKDATAKVKFAVLGTLVILESMKYVFFKNNKSLSFEEKVDMAHIFSRGVEHSEENNEMLLKIAKKLPIEELLALI